MPSSVFLSHTINDKPFVRRLAKDLKAAGVEVWLDEMKMKIGDSMFSSIAAGIESTEYLAVILSPESVASEWVRKELEIALDRELKGHRVAVLPILYKECEIPAFLASKVYADFRDESQYLDALNRLFTRLGVQSRALQAELFIRDRIEKMGFRYFATTGLPGIQGVIQLRTRRSGRIAVQVRTDKRVVTDGDRRGSYILLNLDPREIVSWELIGLPVIIVWVKIDNSGSIAYALWRNANRAHRTSGRIKMPTEARLGSKGTTRSLKKLHAHMWKPNVISLKEKLLFPQRVSEIRGQAWEYYRQWRLDGAISPVFNEVEITLKAWRHMTRRAISQRAIIHKLSLLPFARELVETAQKSKCVRSLPHNGRELHSLRGVFTSTYQANATIEVILEVQKKASGKQRVRFLSVLERRRGSD